MTRWKVHLENLVRFGQFGYRMYVMRSDRADASHFSVMASATLKTLASNVAVSHDDAFLDDSKNYEFETREFLQAMSDAAWEIGIKPKQVEGHADELKAVRYHLEDMRQLAGAKK